VANLGILCERQDRKEEALASFRAALHIAQALGDPRYEGQFLGYLGLLHARQGEHDDARKCLDSGEAMLRSASDQFGLGVLLTSRAEAHQLAGDQSWATASLAAAMTIAGHVGAGSSSELGLAIARVLKLIEPIQD